MTHSLRRCTSPWRWQLGTGSCPGCASFTSPSPISRRSTSTSSKLAGHTLRWERSKISGNAHSTKKEMRLLNNLQFTWIPFDFHVCYALVVNYGVYICRQHCMQSSSMKLAVFRTPFRWPSAKSLAATYSRWQMEWNVSDRPSHGCTSSPPVSIFVWSFR